MTGRVYQLKHLYLKGQLALPLAFKLSTHLSQLSASFASSVDLPPSRPSSIPGNAVEHVCSSLSAPAPQMTP